MCPALVIKENEDQSSCFKKMVCVDLKNSRSKHVVSAQPKLGWALICCCHTMCVGIGDFSLKVCVQPEKCCEIRTVSKCVGQSLHVEVFSRLCQTIF